MGDDQVAAEIDCPDMPSDGAERYRVMVRLGADAVTLAASLRDMTARAETAEAVCKAAGTYFDGYCQAEADSRSCCIDDEQHEAAQAFRDSLTAWRAAQPEASADA